MGENRGEFNSFVEIIPILKDLAQNLRHQRVDSPIVVIESDDWGAQRMPSLAAHRALHAAGIPMDQNPLDRVDTLETAEDLDVLFEELRCIQDVTGRSPVITANFVVANPDFAAIERTGYTVYRPESITQTYVRHGRQGVWNRLQDGIASGLLVPEYHGREHVHVGAWLRLLREQDTTALRAFEQEVYTFPLAASASRRANLMAAFDDIGYSSAEEYEKQASLIFTDGLHRFRELFGKCPVSFIAPCYVWPDFLASLAAQETIRCMQGSLYQLTPSGNQRHYQRKMRYTGQSLNKQPLALVRNVYLEPASAPAFDWLSMALKKTKAAFWLKKPVVVGAHRANFVGGNDPANREHGVSILKQYLQQVTRLWPNVRFMSSAELAGLLLAHR